VPDGVRVTTAAEAAARDALAIASGTPSFALMLQAGTAAAAHIVRVASHRLAFGVHVYAGSGNNGGDGYIVAAQLRRLGVRVLLHEVAAPRTPDAIAAAQLARRHLAAEQFVAAARVATFPTTNAVFVDAMLGTGANGALRGAVARAAHIFRRAREGGALIVSLDVPTGLDASTGELAPDHVVAHHTLTFGTCKAGLLSARAACGEITVLDIGLGAHAEIRDDAARLADAASLRASVPAIAWNAHKGTRGRVLIVGGAPGMAGAAQLAARGALASGAGLVRAYVHSSSVPALQASTPAVVCHPWSQGEHAADAALDEAIALREPEAKTSSDAFANWAHVVAIGPGLGRDRVAERVLRETIRRVSAGNASIVFDADALTLLGSLYSPDELMRLAASRRIVLTPHAGEFGTLAHAFDIAVDTQSPEFARDLSVRRHSAAALATRTGCVVLLKGTPSICVAPDGGAWIVPRGTSTLATGGTGDVLTGVMAALLASQHAAPRADLAQSDRHSEPHAEPHSGLHSSSHTAAETCALAATAAWAHGVAGEHTASRIGVRGSTVEDIVHALPHAWSTLTHPAPLSPDVLSVVPPCVHE
jgi:NAD(P)H-hydrate epimerase